MELSIRERVKKELENRMLGFQSLKEDAQLVEDVILILAIEEQMTSSRAMAILEDAKKVIPRIAILD